MSLGTRFRNRPEATSSLKAVAGAMLIGAALIGGSLGAAMAQDASPEASPAASPVAVAPWIEELVNDEFPVPDGDSTTVTVVHDEAAAAPLSVLPGSFETRPFVQFQTGNLNDTDSVIVILQAPAEFDATGFTLPEDAAELPEGVTPFAAYTAPAGADVIAVFPDLPVGTYVLAISDGHAVTFVVNEAAAVDVPDIFASPEATP
jgi:hypothetical protein